MGRPDAAEVGLLCRVGPGPRGAALTDGAGAPARVRLQQRHDAGLLRGRAAAAHHGGALAGQLHELVLVVPQTHLQGGRVTLAEARPPPRPERPLLTRRAGQGHRDTARHPSGGPRTPGLRLAPLRLAEAA